MDDDDGYTPKPRRGWRYRLARRLHAWSIRLFEDWHEFRFTGPNGERIDVYGYWELGASWPKDWDFRCVCEDDETEKTHPGKETE